MPAASLATRCTGASLVATSSHALATSMPSHTSCSLMGLPPPGRQPHAAPPCLMRARTRPRQPFGLWWGDHRTAPSSPAISTDPGGNGLIRRAPLHAAPRGGPFPSSYHTTTTFLEHTRGTPSPQCLPSPQTPLPARWERGSPAAKRRQEPHVKADCWERER